MHEIRKHDSDEHSCGKIDEDREFTILFSKDTVKTFEMRESECEMTENMGKIEIES